jgi:hypothetical protein
MISWVGHYDAAAWISHNVHRYEKFDLRQYDAAEVRALLEGAGFGDIVPRKAYGPGAPDAADEDVVWECARAEEA